MPFATVDDIAARLGRALTVAEEAMAESVIELVTGLIAELAGEDDAWATALDPVPTYYTVLCIEKVLAIGSNPGKLEAHSEQLGAYSESKTFRRGAASSSELFLTEYEERMVRRIANNMVSGSVRTSSFVHETYVTEDP